ncbi:hypothetical protein J2Z79_001318 [Symbiobacterium terraclitae]|uniref:Uncharacterized protein n=1 Tax=Symbiobacterium terraclitae TaxID=557451 RepID=A0ABS4JQX5_9FIRM|nr:hypothetical protein [Symbiobacterium terraclitae]MBP2017932.1 hypothetical protein [Symbiobacterium terraclitae]
MEILAAVAPLVLTIESYRLTTGEEDPEELALMQLEDRERARAIDEALNLLYFLETHLAEPRTEEGPSAVVGTMDDLEALRALAAAQHGHSVADYQEGRVKAGLQFNHLINHAGDSGLYVPYDFPQSFVLGDLSLGSAVALLAELTALEPVLAERFPAAMARARALPEDDEEIAALGGPVGVWYALTRLCRSAIALDLPIQLG